MTVSGVAQIQQVIDWLEQLRANALNGVILAAAGVWVSKQPVKFFCLLLAMMALQQLARSRPTRQEGSEP